MARIELKPCPVCHTNHDLRLEVHDSCWTVCCGNCLHIGNGFVRGEYCNNEEEAIDAWNRGIRG